MKLKNKVVVITGSSQGLGESLSYKLAKEGASIALLARTESLLKKVKEKIVNDGGEAEYFMCDIRNLQQIKRAVKQIKDKFGKIDILVNNAGVWTDEELEKERPELRKNAFETNALGNINFTYELLPLLKKQGRGHILNVISTAGVGDNALWKTYGATKWAMVGFSKALRCSLKDTKIKVTLFLPGGFDSNLYENAGRPNPHNQPWMMKTDDVADIIVFALTQPNDVQIEQIIVSKIV